MATACPLNFKKVDANLSRFAALVVALLVMLYLFTHTTFILFFLAFDFATRLFWSEKYSLISTLAKLLKNIFTKEEKFTDGAAKKLAGFFGLFFVIALIVIDFFAIWELSLIVAAIFLTCSLLDVFFDYCLGCKVYFIIKKIYPNFMNNL